MANIVGTILQLQSTGNDVMLTADPKINLYKYKYYRYLNFSTDYEQIQLNEPVSFGKKSTFDIPFSGHLLNSLFLCISLPKLTPTSGEYASWTDILGYSIFSDPIEFEVNGVVIDRLYPNAMVIQDELKMYEHTSGFNNMLLRADFSDSSKYNAERQTDLVIPLRFWFSKKDTLALPLVALNNTQLLRVSFKLRKFTDCINYDGNTPPDEVPILDSYVIGEYTFLDELILDSFIKSDHTFVIEQIKDHGVESIPDETGVFVSDIINDIICKEMYVVCVPQSMIDNNNYFVFEYNGSPILKTIELFIDNRQKFSFNETFYRTITPYRTHTSVPLKYIYTIPFSLHPEDTQPSGGIDFTKFDDIRLKVTLESIPEKCYMYIYEVCYNFLKIKNGVLTLSNLI